MPGAGGKMGLVARLQMNDGDSIILSDVIHGKTSAWVALKNVGGIGIDLAIMNMDYLSAKATPLARAKVYTYNRKCSHQILSVAMENMFIMGGAETICFP